MKIASLCACCVFMSFAVHADDNDLYRNNLKNREFGNEGSKGAPKTDSSCCFGITRRIQAHLFLKDYQKAYQEAKAAFEKNPSSKAFLENYITASLHFGEESKAMILFEEHRRRYGVDKD